MRVLIVSWEYPPLIYGGLGRHVHGLAEALAAHGNDVAVVTQAHPGSRPDEQVNGVRVLRATDADRRRDDDLPRWVATLNDALVRAARPLLESWQPDVVHAHDWVAASAGVTLARSAGAPLVATVHATEAGLWNGWLTTPVSLARHDAEAWLVREAARTIVCSAAMRTEVSSCLRVPPGELAVVPNAVDPAAWQTGPAERAALRGRLGIPDGVPLLALAGRVEWEKGGDVAIRALRQVRAEYPQARLVLAGEGRQTASLQKLARRLRVVRAVTFAGHLDARDVAALLGTADVALVPSSYEPFGIVVLEAGAAGTPVIAGAAGGLREIIDHDTTGMLVPPRDPRALAKAVTTLLDDPGHAAALVHAARRVIEARYVWPVAARATEKVYAEAVADPRPPRPRPAPARRGNVLTGEPAGRASDA